MYRSLSLFALTLVLSVGATASAERPGDVDASREAPTALSNQFERSDARTFMVNLDISVEGLSMRDDAVEAEGSVPVQTEVLRVDEDGVAEIAVSIDRPQLTILDSEESVDVGDAIAALQATRLTRSIRSDGHLVDTTGQIADEGTGAPIAATVADVMSLIWIELPGEEVSVGDTWVQTAPMWIGADSASLRAEQQLRYTLAGFATLPTGEVAVIDFTIDERVSGEVPLDDEGLQTMQVSGRGTGSGYVLFNVAGGYTQEVGLETGSVVVYEDSAGTQYITATELTSGVQTP